MIEIIILCNSLNERRNIYQKYRELCHSCISIDNKVVLNFTKISENLVKEIKQNYNVISFIKGNKKVKPNERVRRGELIEFNLTFKTGHEKSGKLYGIVLQNDRGNLYSNTTIIVQAEPYDKRKYNEKFNTIITVNNKKYMVVLNNIQTIDYARIKNKISIIPNEEMRKIENKLMKVIL